MDEKKIKKLKDEATKLNIQMVKLAGANVLNDVLIRDAAKRATWYYDSLKKLGKQLDKINSEIARANKKKPG